MSYKTKEYNGVKVSAGNTKLGEIPNVALPPVLACAKGIPCGKRCYAMKAFRQYESVRNSWGQNHKLIKRDPAGFIEGIRQYLQAERPQFFRWWVSGDTPNQDFLNRIYALAKEFHKVRFLMFTKQHGLTYRKRPPNLAILLSMWSGGWGNTRKDMPRAWYQDGTEERVPADAIECPGHCDSCGMCWAIEKLGKDVVFNDH